jgi:hypothetical protein
MPYLNMMKISSLVILSSLLVGCQATNDYRPSKPYGLSRMKNSNPSGEHFLQKMLEPVDGEAQQSGSSSQPTMSSQRRISEPAQAGDLRRKYGLPNSEIVHEADLSAMIELYRHDLKQLESRQK